MNLREKNKKLNKLIATEKSITRDKIKEEKKAKETNIHKYAYILISLGSFTCN